MISPFSTAKFVLPDDPVQAIEKLIRITRELSDILESEAQAIALRDEVRMLDTSARKDKILPQYESAAREFKARVEEFGGVDSTLLDQLEAEQDHLAAVTRGNQQLLTIQ